MKILMYMALLLGITLVPVRGSDVGKLIPVELIAVCEENGIITVRTDTGDAGYGQNLDAAFRDLKETAPGVIYLDTAEYLVVDKRTQSELVELCPYLKDGVQVYSAEAGIEVAELPSYLAVHGVPVKMKDAVKGSRIPVLKEENGRFHVSEK